MTNMQKHSDIGCSLHHRLFTSYVLLMCTILAFGILAYSPAHAQTLDAKPAQEFDYLWAYQGNVAYFEKDGKIGLVHKDGRILSEAVFDEVYPFDNGFGNVVQNGLWGIIDLNGKIVCQPQWYFITEPHEGMVTIYEKTEEAILQGYMNTAGKVIIPPKWDLAMPFYSGLAYVEKDDKNYYINTKGDIVIELMQDDAIKLHKAYACADEDGQKVYIGMYDREFVYVNKGVDYGFAEGLDLVDESGLYGFRDKSGEYAIEPQYTDAWSFSQGLAAVQKNGTWSFINHDGDVVLDGKWEEAYGFSDNLAAVKKNGKWGYIDLAGNVVFDYQFFDVYSFANGYALVNGLIAGGFINDRGEVICGMKYYKVK